MGVAASAPDDVLERASGWLKRDDVLCLRALSPRARDLTGRAITRKAIPDVQGVYFEKLDPDNWDTSAKEMRAPARAVTAMGQVFGAGCTKLWSYGISSQKLDALQSFVRTTRGGLLVLSLYHASVSSDALVQMCRFAPNLVELRGPIYRDTTSDAIQEISRLCPKLETVEFATRWKSLSPAEEWERYFPNLRKLKLGRRHEPLGLYYRPTALHAITEAARTTSAVEIHVNGCDVFPDLVEAIVGTPLGDRLTTFGCGMVDKFCRIYPEAFLAAARGFPRLTEMGFPDEVPFHEVPFDAPGLFAELARIRPLKSLVIHTSTFTEADVAAAFEHNQLESLTLEGMDGLIYLGDAVAGTQTAAVLRELEITLCNDFRAEDVLCLVRACPKVTRLEWQRGRNDDEESEFEWDSDEEATNEAEIRELIVGRGGKCRIDAPHVYS